MTKLSSRWRMGLLIIGIWTFLGIFFTVHSYLLVYYSVQARADLPQGLPSFSIQELLRINLAEAYIWAVLAPFVFSLARKFPFARQRWKASLAIHAIACLIVAVVQSALSAFANQWLRADLPKPLVAFSVLQLFFFAKLGQNVIFYWVIFGIAQTIDYYRMYRDRELRASQLQAQLVQAQLQVLRMQLHPHFLFNTLNAISALIHQDVELADRMIARLGELLRATLENANLQEVPLRQELEFIQPYLEIEGARLGPRLQVQFSIDAGALDGLVPNMILQPLVENAIRHGIAPRPEPGSLEISAHRQNGTLQLTVRDDGPGIPSQQAPTGVGLANTRARLRQLYGPDQQLKLNSATKGFEVQVSIPFHKAMGEQTTL